MGQKSRIKIMDGFLVKGFSGKRILEGVLPVMGAKNFALKAQAASLLFGGHVLLENMPLIDDVCKMNQMLEDLGVKIERVKKRNFELNIPAVIKTDLDKNTAKSLRSSIVLVGPILAREGKVSFPHPGGCVIGQRPIDVFLEAFKKMGARVRLNKDLYTLDADKLKGAEIFFRMPSVTATETLMMSAVLAKGKTVLYNCACEPEIMFLAEFLNSAGARINGAGTHTIVVQGGGLLKGDSICRVPPDRIEAGSFAIIAALCAKKLKITNCVPAHMRAVLQALQNVGVKINFGKNYLLIKESPGLKPSDIKTREYPGFPTDLQALFSVLLTQASGRSFVFETVFEGRLNYLFDLERMGADVVVCDPHRAIINGPTKLRGRKMESPDLRAGLAFIIAGMVAEGESFVDNANNIDRGYENIEGRLNAVGAEIKRITNNE
ncbi:UDP-N-acetylglucosamine 1-carboxyvinyltransferase [Patescibacteria group bacterium]|nr:UDP-N-acetylglucosamine 1-carboxyvinyltransferase [Patescibacteria group bacterium]